MWELAPKAEGQIYLSLVAHGCIENAGEFDAAAGQTEKEIRESEKKEKIMSDAVQVCDSSVIGK